VFPTIEWNKWGNAEKGREVGKEHNKVIFLLVKRIG